MNFERATADYDLGRKETLMLHADGKSQPVEHATHDGYIGELQLLRRVREGGEEAQRVTADDAVNGLEIIEAEKKSVDSQQFVAL